MAIRKVQLHAIPVPAVSREYADHLNSVFPRMDIKANTPIEEIKWNAGMREVVEYVLATCIKHELSGNINRTRPYLKPYTYIQSLLSKIV